MTTKTLGETIKEARMSKGITLRGFSEKLGISPPHMSDIENDNRKPSDDLLRKIADHLELRFDDLEKKKGKIGDKVKAWVKKEPEVAVLMRKISSMPNGVEKLRQIIDDAEKKRSK